nr:MAG TPA: hypothetical protein [Caudoviricetes sp.]DAJ84525.1 MAG TPA: hypothetical protein [Caudoviricetes sp.]
MKKPAPNGPVFRVDFRVENYRIFILHKLKISAASNVYF